MKYSRHSAAGCLVRTLALLPFLVLTFSITWGLIGFYICFPATAATRFGEISGSHPFFSLATWAPAIAAFAVVVFFAGASASGHFCRAF